MVLSIDQLSLKSSSQNPKSILQYVSEWYARPSPSICSAGPSG